MREKNFSDKFYLPFHPLSENHTKFWRKNVGQEKAPVCNISTFFMCRHRPAWPKMTLRRISMTTTSAKTLRWTRTAAAGTIRSSSCSLVLDSPSASATSGGFPISATGNVICIWKKLNLDSFESFWVYAITGMAEVRSSSRTSSRWSSWDSQSSSSRWELASSAMRDQLQSGKCAHFSKVNNEWMNASLN